MAGAGKARKKEEQKGQRAAQQAARQAAPPSGSNNAAAQQPQQQRPTAFDGPGDSSTGGPPSRGRPASSAAPSVGQPGRGQSQVRAPSQGPSQGHASSQVRGTSSSMLPDRSGNRFAARFIDLPGNAYTIGGLGSVSHSFAVHGVPINVASS